MLDTVVNGRLPGKNSRTNQLFARNYLILLWSVMGTIIVFGFACNLRAMLLKPARDRPIDTTEELYKSGMTVHMDDSSWMENYFITSSNEWQRKANLDIFYII